MQVIFDCFYENDYSKITFSDNIRVRYEGKYYQTLLILSQIAKKLFINYFEYDINFNEEVQEY